MKTTTGTTMMTTTTTKTTTDVMTMTQLPQRSNEEKDLCSPEFVIVRISMRSK